LEWNLKGREWKKIRGNGIKNLTIRLNDRLDGRDGEKWQTGKGVWWRLRWSERTGDVAEKNDERKSENNSKVGEIEEMELTV
jgi:hypothetical protein